MLQKTISGMAGFRHNKSTMLYSIPMQKLFFLLPMLIFVGFKTFGQIQYEKRFEKKTLILNIKSLRGPFILALKDNEENTIDTLAYHNDILGVDYYVYDAWLDNDVLMFAHSQRWLNASLECAIFENGKWNFLKFWPNLLSPEEVLQPHEIKIIDRNHIKVTKGGKSYIHTIDYKERKHTVAEETK